MMFMLGLVLGAVIGIIITALRVAAKGTDEIIADLYGALEEWVDVNESSWMAPDFGNKRYDRSCMALNRAKGW